jgi:hypothetical protein
MKWMPGWPPHGPEIACRNSAYLENGGADWRSWEGGSPEDAIPSADTSQPRKVTSGARKMHFAGLMRILYL